MAGELRHFLNGIQVEEPGGWNDFTEEIERDHDRRLIANKFPNELTFIGDGYALLRALFEDDFCSIIPYRCDQLCDGTWTEVSIGEIIVADIEWELTRCEAKTSIADDGAGARILNNKDIKISPTADKTKNAEEVTPVDEIALEVFDPAAVAGTYLAQTRRAYDWYGCMQHLVLSITDNAVSVTSDWYNALPDDERYALMDGDELRTHDATNPRIKYNFKDLFDAMAIPYNLWAAVERGAGNAPVLRIEPEEYFFGTSNLTSFPNTDGLVQAMDTSLLYQKVTMDSQGAIKNEVGDAQYSLPYVQLRTLANEDFALEGACNTDNILDLINPFVTDTNAIEDAAINGNDDNDEEVFIIQYDQTTSKAVKGDYLANTGSGPFLYNEQLLNLNILDRYNFPSAGVSYTGSSNTQFLAEYTLGPSSTITLTGPVAALDTTGITQQQFDTDYPPVGFDVDNNYGNGTTQGNPVALADSRYTAPAQGYGQFSVHFEYAIISNTSDAGGATPSCRRKVHFNILVRRYDSSNTLLSTQQLYPAYTSAPGNIGLGLYFEDLTFGTPMNTGDYIQVYYEMTGDVDSTCPPFVPGGGFATYEVKARIEHATFASNYVALGGGQIVQANPDLYYATTLTFERHCDPQTWLALKNDFSQRILVSEALNMRIGFVRKVTRTVHNGATEWELLANRDQAFK